MDPDLVVEPEHRDDAPAVDSVVGRAFAHHVEVVDMVREIRASPGYRPGLAFVARVDGDVVGFVMLSDITLQDGERRHTVLSVTPLAVDPDHQRRGIGSELVRTAVAAAAGLGDEPVIVLEGSPRYYGRLGFRFAPDFGITIDLPDGAPPEAAQVHLLPAYDPAVRGHVVYPPAIAAATA